MKRLLTKNCLLGLGLLFLLFINYPSPASATSLDLTGGGEGEINGALFSVSLMNPAGTGYIEPFVRLQGTGRDKDFEEGTNTYQDTVLDEKPHWLDVIMLTSDMVFNIGGVDYLKFVLDIDEPGADGKSTIALTELILYTDGSDQKYPYPDQPDSGLMADKIWGMDTDTEDSDVLLDYNYIGGGSGWWGDMLVEIPMGDAEIGDYFYLYSAFGLADYPCDNNPEEWAVVSTVPVPEPATMLLLGSGLVGLAALGRRRFRKA